MIEKTKQVPPYHKPEIVCMRLLSEQTVMTGSVVPPTGPTNESLDDEIKFNW